MSICSSLGLNLCAHVCLFSAVTETVRVADFEGCVLGLRKHTARGSCQWGRVLSATGAGGCG